MLRGLAVLALAITAASGGADSNARVASSPVTFRSATVVSTLEPAILLVRRGSATINLRLQRVLFEPYSGRSLEVTGIGCSGRLIGAGGFEGMCGIQARSGLRFDAAWTCVPTTAPAGHSRACEGDLRALPTGGLVVDGSMLMVFDATLVDSDAMIMLPWLLVTSQR